MPEMEFDDHTDMNQCRRMCSEGFPCTRPQGHTGNHEAGRRSGNRWTVLVDTHREPLNWARADIEDRMKAVTEIILHIANGHNEKLFVGAQDMDKAFTKAMEYATEMKFNVTQITVKKTQIQIL